MTRLVVRAIAMDLGLELQTKKGSKNEIKG